MILTEILHKYWNMIIDAKHVKTADDALCDEWIGRSWMMLDVSEGPEELFDLIFG